jgi:hypothetical protein
MIAIRDARLRLETRDLPDCTTYGTTRIAPVGGGDGLALIASSPLAPPRASTHTGLRSMRG